MPNTSGLIPFTEMTPSEHSELSRRGAEASAKSRRENKAFKEIIIERLQELEENGHNTKEVLIIKLIERIKSNEASVNDLIKALEFLRDTSGEKPKETLEIENAPSLTFGKREDNGSDRNS